MAGVEKQQDGSGDRAVNMQIVKTEDNKFEHKHNGDIQLFFFFFLNNCIHTEQPRQKRRYREQPTSNNLL